jgi:hypothetical protein
VALSFLPNFRATASALTYTMLAEGVTTEPTVANRAVRYVLAEHGRTPDYLRQPMRILTLVFDLQTLPLTGKVFHNLEPERRARWVALWRKAPISQLRDFVRFYESLAIFGGVDALYPADPKPQNEAAA